MHYQLFVLMVYEELRIQSKQSAFQVAETTVPFQTEPYDLRV